MKKLVEESEVNTWRKLAVCRDMDINIFFPEEGEGVKNAIKICKECPVRRACLINAITNNEEYGVWAGTSERGRKVMIRQYKTGTPLEEIIRVHLHFDGE